MAAVVAIVHFFHHSEVALEALPSTALCRFHHDIIHNETEIYIHILPSTTPPPPPSTAANIRSLVSCVVWFGPCGPRLCHPHSTCERIMYIRILDMDMDTWAHKRFLCVFAAPL